jgi:hypothetical protein
LVYTNGQGVRVRMRSDDIADLDLVTALMRAVGATLARSVN